MEGQKEYKVHESRVLKWSMKEDDCDNNDEDVTIGTVDKTVKYWFQQQTHKYLSTYTVDSWKLSTTAPPN